MARKNRRRVLTTLATGLAAGGIAGAGVANHWYSPAAGVGLAALVGVAVGLVIRRVKRENVGSG
jgi:NhaP-type Na+/H+ or K+/H+ antiporter